MSSNHNLKTKKEAKKTNKKIDWDAQTKKVARFCERRGFTVKFEKCPNGCSTVCFATQEIRVHTGVTPERVFYNLLHEMGHMLIHENHQLYSQNTGFIINNFGPQSLTQRIGEVEEEYDAWRVGYKKAKKMRLKINRKEFEKIKASYLASYFEWAINRKIKKTVKNEVDNALKIAASKKVPMSSSNKERS